MNFGELRTIGRERRERRRSIVYRNQLHEGMRGKRQAKGKH